MNHQKNLQISGSLLAKNTLLNLIGQAVPLLVGVITIPFIVRGLGTERFGLLALARVVLGYFAIFDLGLGRATTKFVAEALGKDDEDQLPGLIWTAVMAQAILGLLGTLIVASITPLLVERILNIPVQLLGETKAIFYILALSVPLILLSSSFCGILEASQRFDLVNAVKIPSSVLTFLLPVVGLLFGLKLPAIVAVILITRFGGLLAFIAFTFHIFPNVRKFSVHFSLFYHLFAFGGWVMVSNVVAPFLRYFDCFMIGALLSMSAIAYYSVPFDVIERLWIIPSSLVLTLFPAFSTLSGKNHYIKTQDLFLRSTKYLLILTAPVTLTLITFAKQILQMWLGSEFAQNSTIVFQILAIGVLIGVLAPIPGAVLQGYGRPDIIAKLYLAYIPLNVALVWMLVSNMALLGAALSFIIRTIIDTILLFAISLKIIRLSAASFLKFLLPTLGTIFLISVPLGLTVWMDCFPLLQAGVVGSLMLFFAYSIWKWCLYKDDKIFLRSVLGGKT